MSRENQRALGMGAEIHEHARQVKTYTAAEIQAGAKSGLDRREVGLREPLDR